MGSLWQGLINILRDILFFFHNNIVSDFGMAIVLLTVLVRVVILPLTIKQTKSMYEMQKLQPKLRALQEKYKDNKEKLQQEMMKFYAENKVNPFGGCLPLILQLPIFFALFRMLITTKELVSATSFFGIFVLGMTPGKALGAGVGTFIPYLLLILLLAVTTYLPQKMMTSDPQQQKMGLYMTPLMVFIGWTLPAGALIYWVTTNLWTMAQQYVMLKIAKPAEVS
ncbi:MAG: YidC/Oxa1 family membrane protein insertase [Firmicutes bacterium]|nr:YidC/Oxa1 family membrane protein insertase [Bacillota bacterium]